MVQALRWFAVVAVVALVPSALPADSGRAAERAGQKTEPNRATREQELARRAVRWARAMVWQISKIELMGGTVRDPEAEARDADPPR